jgi:hypothetical protein
MTKGSLMALAARQSEPIYQQMESLNYEIQNLASNVNYRESILQQDYQTQLAQYNIQSQRDYEGQRLAE